MDSLSSFKFSSLFVFYASGLKDLFLLGLLYVAFHLIDTWIAFAACLAECASVMNG
jgi:hypothetical protein